MGRIGLSAPLAFHVIVYSDIDGMTIWSWTVQQELRPSDVETVL